MTTRIRNNSGSMVLPFEPGIRTPESENNIVMTEHLWHRYRDRIYRFFLSKAQDEDLAKDLTQDLFVKVFQQEKTLDNIDNLEAWLFRVARNRYIDHTRKKTEMLLNESILQGEEEPLHTETVDQAINRCLESLIRDTDQQDSKLILDVFNGDLSQKEAAQQLSIPYSTLKSRVQKTREEVFNRFLTECCRLIYNKNGHVINCEPVTQKAKDQC